MTLPADEAKELPLSNTRSPIQQMQQQGYLILPRPNRSLAALTSPKTSMPQNATPSVVTLPRPLSANSLKNLSGPVGSPRHAMQQRSQDRSGHVRGGFANTYGSSLTGVGLSASPFVTLPPVALNQ